jgi:hypothetical protein
VPGFFFTSNARSWSGFVTLAKQISVVRNRLGHRHISRVRFRAACLWLYGPQRPDWRSEIHEAADFAEQPSISCHPQPEAWDNGSSEDRTIYAGITGYEGQGIDDRKVVWEGDRQI